MELQSKKASLEFSISYGSSYGSHLDRLYCEGVDFWRDLFPGDMVEILSNLTPGNSYSTNFNPGILVPPFSPKNIFAFHRGLFDEKRGPSQLPVVGRYYPKGFAWKPLNSFKEDNTPFRIIALEGDNLVVDQNHPLAQYPLTFSALMVEDQPNRKQRGGSLQDIAELVTGNGPGMYLPGKKLLDIYHNYPFQPTLSGNDEAYYKKPRLVHHLDQTARSHVQHVYEKMINPGDRVLDFMASWDSHLSPKLAACPVTGLGLNEQELKHNRMLQDFVVHNVNLNPILPFTANSFEVVICTVSIEYLLYPREIMEEIARILVPDGLFIVTVSDRWFTGKEISCWKDLHPFERLGHVVHYFTSSPSFTDLHTETVRGYPRPVDDKYSSKTEISDNLYFLWGSKLA